MVAENLALQATALGLAATPVGAFEAGAVKAGTIMNHVARPSSFYHPFDTFDEPERTSS
jgi:nitroreductase